MNKLKIKIGYLYGDLMNIYGDTGNIIALKNRTLWRGIEAEIQPITIGDSLKPGDIDLYFFGGGQDQAQKLVSDDLLATGKGNTIKKDVDGGVPLLSICGGYQLLGEYYKPHNGPKLQGTGLFPVYTVASFDRMIGNIVIKLSPALVTDSANDPNSHNFIVGFENHSGKTFLDGGAVSLGRVVKGFGNNGEDKSEGCIYKNAIGCYMHGSLLPKNPYLADWLITKSLETKYGEPVKLTKLDDELENQAHRTALLKFG